MAVETFTREEIPGAVRYGTAAGWYTATEGVSGWVLATPGQIVGVYVTLELAEAALVADVDRRMWL